MVRMRKVLKDWNVKMEEEGKPHMRILMKDVQKRVTQRRRKARMTPKARQRGEAFQSVWGSGRAGVSCSPRPLLATGDPDI